MHRNTMEWLLEWQKRSDRKPLIIQGARQVGKTWLMREFGAKYFESTAYINFEKNNRMSNLFNLDLDTKRIISGLEIETNSKIIPNQTLIILDEIQECPNALSALKYFNENAPEYSIISAGSLLGVARHAGASFPVGKVEFKQLYPLSFNEFLSALNEDRLLELLKNKDFNLIRAFSDKFINLMRLYFFVGGMPEAVMSFAQYRDFEKVRNIQNNILQAYTHDFSKHIPGQLIPKINMLWSAIPNQLAKENKKFIYSKIHSGARSKEYETALNWIIDAGLAHKINRASKPALPIKAYEDPHYFKLFVLDIGLLGALASLNPKVMLEGERVFTEFKGALTEQYVLQELKTLPFVETAYWTNERNSAEIDFIIQYKNLIIPIEAKSSINLKSKSLGAYIEKFAPAAAIRASTSHYQHSGGLYDIPLYMIEELGGIIAG